MGNNNKAAIQDFDENDKLKLAKLFLLKDLQHQSAEKLLSEIFSVTSGDTVNLNTQLVAGTQLMEIQYQRRGSKSSKQTVEKIKNHLREKVSIGTLYNTAVALIKYGEKEEGIRLLQDIIKNQSDTVWARKSYFLLGRIALTLQRHMRLTAVGQFFLAV